MQGKSSSAVRSRVAEVLQQVALSDKAEHFPHELSGGQRQRVALARAIADLPRVLLLDEPLAALDAKLREQMQVELIRLQRDLGITFVFVTHAQDEALAMSHRIGVMDRGRIEQLDEPARIYGFPRNKFVADFIGHCTIVEANVHDIDGVHLSLATPLSDHMTAAATPEAKVSQHGWLALRPEQLHIGRPGAFPELPNRVGGTVRGFLYVGDVTTYVVELPNGLRIEALLANTSPERMRFFEEGESVEVAWPAEVGRYLHE
jgi:spermidine/putrescine transport system ATP-binding protein